MSNRLRAGFAKVDITPENPVELMGSFVRTELSEGVFSRLFVKSAIFEDDRQKVLLIAADLIAVDHDYVVALRDKIEKLFGIPHANIMVCASHTHCGPVTLPLLARTGQNREYLEFLDSRILDAVSAAMKDCRQVTIGYAATNCDININRRLPSNGDILFAPNPEGACDKEVAIIKVDDLAGNNKGILFNYACHPTTIGGLEISADFPGAAESCLEQRFPGAVAMFTNGCCGDIRVGLMQPGSASFKDGTKADVVKLGSEFAEAVINALTHVRQKENPSLACCVETVDLPLSGEYSAADLQKQVSEKEQLLSQVPQDQRKQGVNFYYSCVVDWAKRTLEAIRQNTVKKHITAEVQVIRIGDVMLVALPGEVFCEIGLEIKRHFKSFDTIVVGYANGDVGYIPTAAALAEGGYEATGDALAFYNLPCPFAKETEAVLLEAVVRIGDRLEH